MVQDTSPNKPVEAALPEWVRNLRSADGLFVTDEQQRIVAWTASAEAALGHRAEDVIGRPCYEVIAGTDVTGHPVCRPSCAAVTNAARGRGTASYDVAACTCDGARVWVNNSIMVARGDSESGTFLVHLFRPKTEAPAQRRQASQKAPQRLKGAHGARRGGGQPLSRRELETLRMLAAGQTTVEIAEALTISRFTARNHINNLLRKLGARNRIEGLLLATERHLI